MTIPPELDEAPRMDGAGSFAILRIVIQPLSKPALAIVSLFAFIGSWNDFLGRLIYTQSLEKNTLAVGLDGSRACTARSTTC
jgi:multiple sugar transport system permease protein